MLNIKSQIDWRWRLGKKVKKEKEIEKEKKKKIQKIEIGDWKSKKSCFSKSSSVPQNCRIELQSPSFEATGVCG